MTKATVHVGIDLGGTKIAGVAMDRNFSVIRQVRQKTPRNDYKATLKTIASMIGILIEGQYDSVQIGIGIPGSIAPSTGSMQNANSTWLNDRPLLRDLETELGRPVRCENDANCFVLSETNDGNATAAHTVFGVILGTGCGGGLTIGGKLINGPRNIGGEWGHNPLPWPTVEELPGPLCWCGQHGCLETWLSGPALAADHARVNTEQLLPEAIAARAKDGNSAAAATLARHADRLARGLAHVVNIFDPDTIVLGGGLSDLDHLYRDLPDLMAPYIFSVDKHVDIRPPKWGSTSGVRGAARLWQQETHNKRLSVR